MESTNAIGIYIDIGRENVRMGMAKKLPASPSRSLLAPAPIYGGRPTRSTLNRKGYTCVHTKDFRIAHTHTQIPSIHTLIITIVALLSIYLLLY